MQDEMKMDAEDLRRMNSVLRHRLRNVASGIKSAAMLLSKELADSAPPSVLEYFPLMVRECDEVAEIMRRFGLLFDTPPSGGGGEVGPLLQVLIDRLNAKHPRSAIAVDCAEAAAAVAVADSDAVLTVLLEVAENAVEAGGNGPVRVECRLDAGHLHFRITGGGTAPDDCERIFLPFHTTRTRHMGIGLAIARRLVTVFGGSISAVDTGDTGMAVDIVLPCADARGGDSSKEEGTGE